MRRLVLVLVAAALVVPAAPAAAGTVRSDRGDCGRDGGDCGHQRYDDDHRGGCNNFCPKFDKSPVDHSFNLTVCVMPGSCPGQNGQPPPPKDSRDESIACLVPAPFHCDQPRSLITDPGKLVTFPVTIVEMSLQFAQSILRLVV